MMDTEGGKMGSFDSVLGFKIIPGLSFFEKSQYKTNIVGKTEYFSFVVMMLYKKCGYSIFFY